MRTPAAQSLVAAAPSRRNARAGRPSGHGGRSRGLGAIAAITVLLMLAALVAAILRLSSAATSASAQELLAVRASLAARAGLEWGLYQAAKGGWVKCSGDAKELDLSAATGMRVAVSCDSLAYREGESSPGVPQDVRVYTLEAVACNSDRTCPDPERVAEPGYVERARRIHTLQ